MQRNDPALALVAANDAARENAARPPAPVFDIRNCYGPLGDYVRLWAPHTEAAPVAIYASALAALGALIGRGPTWRFGNTAHHARLFVLLIGPSGSGRKGTAMALGVRDLLYAVDDAFAKKRVASGLSSAEGLIAEVRDASPDQMVNGHLKQGDPGVDDKRLLVVEGEMGGALQAMMREGNRLSAITRDLWDGSDVRSMVKQNPQTATNPHVCIAGCITSVELRKLLSGVSLGNGLANRLLPIWTTRARSQPEDSAPDPAALARVIRLISSRVDTARSVGNGHWTADAAALWAAEYDTLTTPEDSSDTVRALLERGAPYVRRIAFVLALLDGTGTVDVCHLESALALWQYVADTWRTVYHDGSMRSSLAEKLRVALNDAGPNGLTRSQIRADVVRSGDVSADRIAAALQELAGSGLAIRSSDSGTGGRKRERWQHARFVGAIMDASLDVDDDEATEHDDEGKGVKGGKAMESTDNAPFAPFTPFPPDPLSRPVASGPGLDPYEWPDIEDAA